jgi:hypothetical protein
MNTFHVGCVLVLELLCCVHEHHRHWQKAPEGFVEARNPSMVTAALLRFFA